MRNIELSEETTIKERKIKDADEIIVGFFTI